MRSQNSPVWTELLIDEIDKSVRTILARKFPKITLADREDVRQEVQVKIWNMLRNGKKIDRLESYLWKVVLTTTLAVMGDRFKEVSLDDMVDGWNGRLPQGLTVPPEIAEMERRELLLGLTAKLAMKRRVVIKHYLEGMSLEETAAHLGWSLPKVRHLFYRSIKELQHHLEKQERSTRVRPASQTHERENRDFPLPEPGNPGEVIPE
jgi:RNA polymerase sigma factor (sigma-70 family)